MNLMFVEVHIPELLQSYALGGDLILEAMHLPKYILEQDFPIGLPSINLFPPFFPLIDNMSCQVRNNIPVGVNALLAGHSGI
jgi:hypothetical protein